jgi:hypothetical protein
MLIRVLAVVTWVDASLSLKLGLALPPMVATCERRKCGALEDRCNNCVLALRQHQERQQHQQKLSQRSA